MRQDYANQLAAIESEFERERAGLLKQNEEEIKALFNQHQKTEEDFLKKKKQNVKSKTLRIWKIKSPKMLIIKLSKRSSSKKKCKFLKSVWRT